MIKFSDVEELHEQINEAYEQLILSVADCFEVDYILPGSLVQSRTCNGCQCSEICDLLIEALHKANELKDTSKTHQISKTQHY